MISMIRRRACPTRRVAPTTKRAHGFFAVKRAATALRSPGAWMMRTYKCLIPRILTLIGATLAPSFMECMEIHVYLPPDRVNVETIQSAMTLLTTPLHDDRQFEI